MSSLRKITLASYIATIALLRSPLSSSSRSRSTMAAAAPASRSSPALSPCASFIEESLILPTRNARLFAPAFLLVSAHTFVFLAVAAFRVHPLATAILAHADALSTTDHAVATGKIREHANDLVLVYLAYLASKLTVQIATVLAASATCSGERPSFAKLVRCWMAKERLIRGPFVTAAYAAVLELASMALLAALSLATWRGWHTGPGSSASQSLHCVLLLLALLLHPCVGAVVPVSIAVSAGEEGCCGARALLKAWRLMGTRRKEAAVQAVAASLLPVVTYPVYVLALDVPPRGNTAHAFIDLCRLMLVLGVLYGFVLPSTILQLYSTVAATVFHHRCKHGIYVRTKLVLAS